MNLTESLKGIVGPDGCVMGRDVVAALPSLGLTSEAELTLRPGSTAEISEIMRLCSEAGQKVVPHGGLSGAVQGVNTNAAEIVLSLERLNRIEEIMSKTGSWSSRRELRCRPCRTQQTPTACISRWTSVRAAVLRLRTSLPVHTTALVATDDFAKIPQLLRHMNAVLGGQMTSCDAMWQSYYRIACRGTNLGPPPLSSDHPFYLLIEASGGDQESEAARLAAGLSAALEEGLITAAVVAKSEAERAALWAIRDDMECLAAFSPWKGFDISLPVSKMESYMQSVDQGATPDPRRA